MNLTSVTSGPPGRPREVHFLSLNPDLAPQRKKPNPYKIGHSWVAKGSLNHMARTPSPKNCPWPPSLTLKHVLATLWSYRG